LLFQLAEFLRGVFEIIALQKDEALIIEVLGGNGRRDLGLVFFAAAAEQIGDRIEEVGARAVTPPPIATARTAPPKSVSSETKRSSRQPLAAFERGRRPGNFGVALT
jgi:hypothetical protein